MPRTYARTIEESYQSVQLIVNHLMGNKLSGWFFRGQSNFDWGLKTGLSRTIDRVDPDLDPFALENSLIGEFKRNFNSQDHTRPGDSDLLGWLALMQHYRAPTRLLDWTTSPLIALYFATENRDSNVDGAVWAFNPVLAIGAHGDSVSAPWDHTETWKVGSKTVPTIDGVSFASFTDYVNHRIRSLIHSTSRWPLPVAPNWVDSRMAAQQSVFTVAGDQAFALEGLSYKKHRIVGLAEPERTWIAAREPRTILRKFRIPANLMMDIQKYLYRVGVSSAAVFPGLDGLGQNIGSPEIKIVPINDHLPGHDFGIPLRHRKA